MIGRKSDDKPSVDEDTPQGFDDFTLSLGDVMRGERATLGKSLLDVQRELKIKASYIAAIENCDPSAFETPGFIAGYVRSYSRYLGMDPEEAFASFCKESGFAVAHGMSEQASIIRKPARTETASGLRDPLAQPNLPFAPARESWMSRIEPGAIGSSLVLIALISGLGYGGWSVLKEVQRVQVAPVDQTPAVLSELDPLDAATAAPVIADGAGVFTPPSNEAFDRLYRPEALDVPVLVARDAPISTLDPAAVGVFSAGARGGLPQVQDSSLAAVALAEGLAREPGALAATQLETVTVVAARPSWVQIRDENGATLHSGILNAGDTFEVPKSAGAASMRAGEAGALYFAVNGTTFGPLGPSGQSLDVSLTSGDIKASYAEAQAGADEDLMIVMAELAVKEQLGAGSTVVAGAAAPVILQVFAEPVPGITIVATREAWVRVKSPSGTRIFEAVMQPGDTYHLPQTDQPPTIRTGDAGAVFFAVNGQTYGPYGANGAIKDNMALTAENLANNLSVADLSKNKTLARAIAELR
jgi:hypothetical protein